ncbi:MAG: MMPL family transporter [Bacillus sp. (in: firmicutes)]
MKRFAETVIKHFKFTFIIWLIIVIGLSYYAIDLPSKLQGDGFRMDGQYENVQNELADTFDFPKNTMIVVFEKEKEQSQEQFYAHIESVLNDIEELHITTDIQSPLANKDQMKDTVAYSVLSFDEDNEEVTQYVNTIRKITDDYSHTMLTGKSVISDDMSTASKHDLMIAEMIGLPFALLVLLLAFGSVVAAIIPLVIGGFTVLSALGILTLLGNSLDLSVFLLNVAPMIGLALSIDFALLFINRYKEELQHSEPRQAVKTTIQTAGKSIIFSAICVFIGLAAMLIIEIDIFRTVAIGGMVVVAMAVFASLTLLPAILMLVGKHLNKGTLFKQKKDSSMKWRSFAEAVMKRPIMITIIATFILIIGIIPVKDIVLSIPDEQSLPASYESKEAISLINEAFQLEDTSTVYIIAERDGGWTTEEGLGDLEKITDSLNADTLVEETTSLYSLTEAEDSETLYGILENPESQLIVQPIIDQFVRDEKMLLPVTLNVKASSSEAQEWVRSFSINNENIDYTIGGDPKFNQEIFDEISDKVWIGIALVLVSTYLILLIAFRSIIIPLKAIIMNVVGLTSTFGILVWIFQNGHFGINPSDIALIIPVFVFSIVFGLSMDYEVFLISRIHEAYVETGDNDEATIVGLSSTSKIITSAALIMIVITGAFAFTGVVPVKQIGIGIALAIFIDATIIRLLLVPSLMKLLGDWNWWLPFTKKKHTSTKGKTS